jgi:predicted metallo-beta-lactamase superfamily hydrolase
MYQVPSEKKNLNRKNKNLFRDKIALVESILKSINRQQQNRFFKKSI